MNKLTRELSYGYEPKIDRIARPLTRLSPSPLLKKETQATLMHKGGTF